ncbi:MAG: hypothetical protein IE884_06755 [Sulfuricurvum sp.]|nr:hypothetical protein [Sulfuricurvum sp.]
MDEQLESLIQREQISLASIRQRAVLSNPRFFSAFNRSVFRVVSELLFYLGFVWAMLDPYHRSWHDRTGRTLVINA